MTGAVISYGEYAKALSGLAKEAATAKAELLAAHEAEAAPEKAYRVGQAKAWATALRDIRSRRSSAPARLQSPRARPTKG